MTQEIKLIESKSSMAKSKSILSRIIPNIITKFSRMIGRADDEDRDFRTYDKNFKKELRVIKELGFAITFGIHVGFVNLGVGIGYVYENQLLNTKLIKNEIAIINIFREQKIYIYDKFLKTFMFFSWIYAFPIIFSERSACRYIFRKTYFEKLGLWPDSIDNIKALRIWKYLLMEPDPDELRNFLPPYELSNIPYEEEERVVHWLQAENLLPSRDLLIETFNRCMMKCPRHCANENEYISWIKGLHITDIHHDGEFSTIHEYHLNYVTRCWTNHTSLQGPVLIIESSQLQLGINNRRYKDRVITPLYIHTQSLLADQSKTLRLYTNTTSNVNSLSLYNRPLIKIIKGNYELCDDNGISLTQDIEHISPMKNDRVAHNDTIINNLINGRQFIIVGTSNIERIDGYQIMQPELTQRIISGILLTMEYTIIAIVNYFVFFIVSQPIRHDNTLQQNPISSLWLNIVGFLTNFKNKYEPANQNNTNKINRRREQFNINKMMNIRVKGKVIELILFDYTLYKLLWFRRRRTAELNTIEQTQIGIISNTIEAVRDQQFSEHYQWLSELYYIRNYNHSIPCFKIIILTRLFPETLYLICIFNFYDKIPTVNRACLLSALIAYLLINNIHILLLINTKLSAPLKKYLITYIIVINKSKPIYYPLYIFSSNAYTLLLAIFKILIIIPVFIPPDHKSAHFIILFIIYLVLDLTSFIINSYILFGRPNTEPYIDISLEDVHLSDEAE